jgi:hypothetical protein
MNVSQKVGVIIWATAGCGSRSCTTALVKAGMDDMLNVVENFVFPVTGPFTHQQGIPKGFEKFPIICLTRNPYSRIVSAFLDEKRQYLEKEPTFDYSFDYFLKNIYLIEHRYPNSQADFFVEEWEKLNVRPNYFIKMEKMEEDLQNCEYLKNLKFTDDIFDDSIRKNNYAFENEYDEYEGNFQKYQKYYTQELADFVCSKIGHYFDIFGYSKESWK